MPEAVIVSALRTPIGTARKGTLRDTSAFDLAHHVVSEAAVDLDATKVDDVILGEGLYGGGVLARHAAITAGLGGSGCSLGHPVAATGARMLKTLAAAARKRAVRAARLARLPMYRTLFCPTRSVYWRSPTLWD